MLRLRRTLLVTSAVVGVTVHTDAFKVDFHKDITQKALSPQNLQLPTDVTQKLKSIGAGAGPFAAQGFNTAAVQEIVDANLATDTGDCSTGFERNVYLPGDVPTVPAEPCGERLLHSDTPAAIYYLSKEPAEDHFDNESIVAASDQIFSERNDVLTAVKEGRYVAARRILGKALHGLQDFYAHTNYVQLGFQAPDDRIGTLGGFRGATRGQPTIAGDLEPTCVDGSTLNTKELTSGHFFMNLDASSSDGWRDLPIISRNLKCRHGWTAAGLTQPGINKDEIGRPFFNDAYNVASSHSTRFVKDLIAQLDKETDSQKLDRIVGLLGYEANSIIEGFQIGVPGAPGGYSWDTATGSALKFFVEGTKGLKNIQPDVLVCMQSKTVPNTCAALCEDADWNLDLNAYVCEQPIGPAGRGVLVEKDLRILVQEMDPIGGPGPLGKWVPNQVIANFRVDDARACDPYCTLQLDQDRALWIRFKVTGVSQYGGPRRSQPVVLPPAQTVPVAKPSGIGSTSSTTSTPAAAPALASAATTGTSPTNPTAFAPSTTTATALRTVDGIDQRLALRDLDNCTGSDVFYPAPSATVQSKQAYQMAAFSLAISDPATKQAVLNAIQARVGDDAFFSAMTDVIANPLQSQALVTAYQNTATNIGQQISSSGLTSLMASPVPPTAIPSYVDRWLASKLSTPALISSAVNMMASSSLTAECTVNELAKEGFTDMVLAR